MASCSMWQKQESIGFNDYGVSLMAVVKEIIFELLVGLETSNVNDNANLINIATDLGSLE